MIQFEKVVKGVSFGIQSFFALSSKYDDQIFPFSDSLGMFINFLIRNLNYCLCLLPIRLIAIYSA